MRARNSYASRLYEKIEHEGSKMERLRIKNFLNIKEADIDVGKINLIIGPQASGKSIIAKLLYFFHEFVSATYLIMTIGIGGQSHIKNKKEKLSIFQNIFPKYVWSNQVFHITYNIGDIEISIGQQKDKSGKLSLYLEYPINLVSLYRKIRLSFKKRKDEYKRVGTIIDSENFVETYKSFEEIFNNIVINSKISKSIYNPVFIPAIRSFFANIQKNISSLLVSGIKIDYFIQQLGLSHEIMRIAYDSSCIFHHNEDLDFNKKVIHLTESILIGKYKFENNVDWIENKNKKINIANTSSGQQEVLPMLLIILGSVWKPQYENVFFIEEPEAHLFPISQKHIISFFSLIYNRKAHNFVLTTHSPYIITAINNAIMASETAKQVGKEAVNKIMDLDYSIKYEDVRAYTIRDGVVESIMDEESRLIGASIIDSVSDEFDNVFDSLINLRMEHGR